MKMYRPHRLCPRNSKPKEPSLYRSLCVSILCMFLSTVMLVGTTMAWFSDSLQTGVYTITSANFSTTVYYCTDLSNAEGVPNNWQRLNPSNTTLFGGGSLSSGDGQVAYLKLVSNSTIPLKYKFTLTAFGESGNIGNLSLAGCQYKNDSDGNNNVALTERDLTTANPTPDPVSSQEVVFDVPAATKDNTPAIVYAVLKLTCSPTDQTTTYNFSLRLEIIQGEEGAGVTESNSPATNTELTMEIGNAPSTPAPTAPIVSDSSGEGAQQPDDGNNSGTGDTNPTTGSTGETEPTTPEAPADPPAEVKPSGGSTETDTPSNGENLS